MDIRWWQAALLAAILLVPVSSFLGLSGRIVFGDNPLGDGDGGSTPGAWKFFSGVWTGDYTKGESAGWTIVADATFIATTVAALAAAILLGARFHPALGAAAGLVGNWVAYAASYSALSGIPSETVTDPGGLLEFVWEWGWPGLVFCGLAAPAVSLLLRAQKGVGLWAWRPGPPAAAAGAATPNGASFAETAAPAHATQVGHLKEVPAGRGPLP